MSRELSRLQSAVTMVCNMLERDDKPVRYEAADELRDAVSAFIAASPVQGAASASEAKFGQGGATPDNSGPINHAEAYELACAKRDKSNLARCYIDLRAALAERAQAVQPKLVIALPDYEQHRIVIASDEVVDGERLVCAAIEPVVQPVAGQAKVEEIKRRLRGMIGNNDMYRQGYEWTLQMVKNVDYFTDFTATPAPEQEAAQVERECTCPSGNGSLAWPCPQHPPGDVMRPFGATAGQHEVTRLDLLSLIHSQMHRVYASAIDREEVDTKYMVQIEEALRAVYARAELASGSREGRDGCNESGNLGSANTNKGGEA